MNHVRMAIPKDISRGAGRGEARKPKEAFDLWLQRGLHQLFDEVAKEPVPEDILRLIEDDRGRAPDGED